MSQILHTLVAFMHVGKGGKGLRCAIIYTSILFYYFFTVSSTEGSTATCAAALGSPNVNHVQELT